MNESTLLRRRRCLSVLAHCDGTHLVEQRVVSPQSGDVSSSAFAGNFSDTPTACETTMSKRVADVLVETLQAAGVKTCYGIVGDTLNRIAHAIERSEIDWVHMRHE